MAAWAQVTEIAKPAVTSGLGSGVAALDPLCSVFKHRPGRVGKLRTPCVDLQIRAWLFGQNGLGDVVDPVELLAHSADGFLDAGGRNADLARLFAGVRIILPC
jgi:hypothetical protein